MMTSSVVSLASSGLPLRTLPIPPRGYVELMISTTDGLPGYFDSELVESATIPENWNMHFDVVQEMREQGCWGDVKAMIDSAARLQDAGAKFAEKWNHMTEECFGEHMSTGGVLKLKLEKQMVTEWNEKTATLRRELEKEHALFLGELEGFNLRQRTKKCFSTHRNLGSDGDGEKWWAETVEQLLQHHKEWMTAAFTFEMWLEDTARSVVQQAEITEIRVYADVLCASFEQGQGMTSRKELVYLIREGKMSKKGKLAWVSVELGHVTER